MSRSEKEDDSSMDSNCSEEGFMDQAESSTATESENSSTTEDPRHVPLRIMVNPSFDLSNHSSAPSSPAQKTHQLDVAASRCAISLKDLRKSSNTLTPGQIPKAISHEKSDVCGVQINQRDLSHFAANRNADIFTPQCNPEIRSFPKNLTEKSTPSPDKRGVETDLELVSIKRFRKTPESNSDRPEALTESNGSNSSISVAEDVSRKSPIYLQIQQSIQKNKESKSLNTPLIPSKRKRKILDSISSDSNTENNLCSSETISPLSAVNIHESSTNMQMLEREVDVDKSDSRAETLASIQDCSAASKSLAMPANLDDLRETGSSIALPFSASIASVDASSAKPNIKAENQKDSLLPDIDLGGPTFTSKSAAMHPTTITDTSIGPNKVTGEQRVKVEIPENGTQYVVHPLGSNHGSNHGSASKSQTSPLQDVKSRIGEHTTRDSASLSSKKTPNLRDSAIETQILESPLSNPKFLISDVRSSSFPERSDSATSNVSHRALELNACKKEITNQSEFGPSQSSTQYTGSRPLSKEFSLSGSQRMDCGSSSEETLRNENSSEAEISSTSQRSHPGVNTEESAPPLRLGMDQRFGSNGMFDNLPGDEASQSFLRLLLDLKYAAINIPVVPIDRIENVLRYVSRVESLSSNQLASAGNRQEVLSLNESLHYYANVGRFLFPSTLHYFHPPTVRSDNNPPYIDVSASQASTSTYQPCVTDFLSSRLGSNYLTPPSRLRSDENLERQREESESSSSSRSLSPLPDIHPEYVVNALTLLSSLLERIMKHNKDEDQWLTCKRLFRHFFESGSDRDRMRLHSTLMLYLANRGFSLWIQSIFTLQEATPETLMSMYHEKLALIIITIIGSVLDRNKMEFSKAYTGFEKLRSFFTQYWYNQSVEAIQDGVSRKRTADLNEMIQGIMLMTQMAIRLILMHMGENNELEYLERIFRDLSEEDKMYIRRSLN